MTEFCSLEGKLALVTGASRGIGRAIAVELARGGAQVVVGYRSRRRGSRGRRVGDRRSRPPGRRRRSRAGRAPGRGGGRSRHPGQQRRSHARRPDRADVGRGLANRARHESRRCLPHLPGGRPRNDAPPVGLDRQPDERRRHPRQSGADELRRVEGGDHRIHEVAGARARIARSPGERHRAGIHPDGAHRRPPGGGCSRRSSRTPRSAGSVRRRTSPGRYASSAPTRPRS